MSIKIDRAEKLSDTGRYPQTFAAMLAHVSLEIVGTVSSRTLARIIDALADASTAAKAVAREDVAGDGGLWDNRTATFREFA